MNVIDFLPLNIIFYIDGYMDLNLEGYCKNIWITLVIENMFLDKI